jgi:hypothetical protein
LAFRERKTRRFDLPKEEPRERPLPKEPAREPAAPKRSERGRAPGATSIPSEYGTILSRVPGKVPSAGAVDVHHVDVSVGAIGACEGDLFAVR